MDPQAPVKMTPNQLRSDIDQAKAFVQSLDQSLPGACQANRILDRLAAAAETPLVLDIVAAILTEKGY